MFIKNALWAILIVGTFLSALTVMCCLPLVVTTVDRTYFEQMKVVEIKVINQKLSVATISDGVSKTTALLTEKAFVGQVVSLQPVREHNTGSSGDVDYVAIPVKHLQLAQSTFEKQ